MKPSRYYHSGSESGNNDTLQISWTGAPSTQGQFDILPKVSFQSIFREGSYFSAVDSVTDRVGFNLCYIAYVYISSILTQSLWELRLRQLHRLFFAKKLLIKIIASPD